MSDYVRLAEAILSENSQVLQRVDSSQVDRLVDEIAGAEKVFLFAVGRAFLSLQCLGKRLGHLGTDCQIVGAVNEKPIGPKDLMLIASGSGESRLAIQIAEIAKSKGARVGLITSAPSSTIKSLSEFVVHLPCPTKNDPGVGVKSVQAMSTLFDQSLHLLGDVVALLLQERKDLAPAELWQRHANLE